MKKLRKVLSLALVVALALSLFTVAAAKNYADYPDKGDVTEAQIEAVDVLTALGIFQGDDNGSLLPKSTFTRAHAAKIVTYITVGATAAEKLASVPDVFSDVPASHWANKYIAYAVEKGIINGYGNGKYGPNDPITGSAAAKLLLTALGYGKKGEYVGVSWEINAITDAIKYGILGGVDLAVDYTAPATREQVIQYAFNTIRPNGVDGKNYIVEYSSIIGSYVASGSTIAGGVAGAKEYLGVQNFNLVFVPDTNELGIGIHRWSVLGRDITGDYISDLIVGSFVSNPTVTKGSLYSEYTFADSVEIWQNGLFDTTTLYPTPSSTNFYPKSVFAERGSAVPVVSDQAALPATVAHNGIYVQLIDANYDGKVDKAIFTTEYLAKVTKVNAAAGTVDVSAYIQNTGTPDPILNIPAEGFAKDEYVVIVPTYLATPAVSLVGAQVLSIVKADVVTAKPTAYTTHGGTGALSLWINSVTVNGSKTWVSIAQELDNSKVAASINLAAPTDSIFYLDSHGSVIGYEAAKVSAASLDYLFVTDANTDSWSAPKIAVTYTDGKKGVLELALKANGDAVGVPYATIANDKNTSKSWYSYALNAEGKAILTARNTDFAKAGANTTAASTSDGAGSNQWKISKQTPSQTIGSNNVYATSGTVLKVNGKTYTGYASFPDVAAASDTYVLLVLAANPATGAATNNLAVVYVVSSAVTGSGEFGVITEYYGNTFPAGESYTVRTKAHPEGEDLFDPTGAAPYARGSVVEIAIAPDGTRTVGTPPTGPLVDDGTIIGLDTTYINIAGTLYYINADTIIFNAIGGEDALLGIETVDVWGGTGNVATDPAYAIIIVA